ncbi:MAG TPA: nucleoside recognition domain-containing protein [Myxococcota bacterium]|nr:nucleoside recognition domain-containing protein [Myxococcota bacterium]
MLNGIFVALIAAAVLAAAFAGRMPDANDAAFAAAKSAVDVTLGLVGAMALWLGFMRVLREAGFLGALARGLLPVLRRLFPDVPAEHPALGAIVLNLAANVLGLGNAATPFGLLAMRELERLNPRPGVATNSMALFLALNTAGLAVLPLGAIAVRASLGSANAAGIVAPSLVASLCATLAALVAAKALERIPRFAPERAAAPAGEPSTSAGFGELAGLDAAERLAAVRPAAAPARRWLAAAFALALAAALARTVANDPSLATGKTVLASWLLPSLMAAIALAGFVRRVPVYDAFIAGAREGLGIAVTVLPFMLAILVAVALFRASGALDALTAALAPVTGLVGFPAEALPMALIRPLSGSGALAVMTETMQHYGPDSFPGFLVCVINGSSETTFYVLALYLGSVGVRASRHTVLACLAADLAGLAGALAASRFFF